MYNTASPASSRKINLTAEDIGADTEVVFTNSDGFDPPQFDHTFDLMAPGCALAESRSCFSFRKPGQHSNFNESANSRADVQNLFYSYNKKTLHA